MRSRERRAPQVLLFSWPSEAPIQSPSSIRDQAALAARELVAPIGLEGSQPSLFLRDGSKWMEPIVFSRTYEQCTAHPCKCTSCKPTAGVVDVASVLPASSVAPSNSPYTPQAMALKLKSNSLAWHSRPSLLGHRGPHSCLILTSPYQLLPSTARTAPACSVPSLQAPLVLPMLQCQFCKLLRCSLL